MGGIPFRDRYRQESPIRPLDHLHDPHLLRIRKCMDLMPYPATPDPLQFNEPIQGIDPVQMIRSAKSAVSRKSILHPWAMCWLSSRTAMRPFLQRLAELILQHHRNEMDRIAVVLPSKRAGLHLRKYLAQANGGPLWSPEILDIGAFMQRTTGLKQGSSLELLFLLYETHVQQLGVRADPFAEFMEWAPITLRDMSEVDAHLIDLDLFYRDLRSFHELEDWSFRLGELSPGQERLNANWRTTGELHRAFIQRMSTTGVGTSGFVARQCASHLSSEQFQLPWTMVWFAGLNALDPASTAVIDALQKVDHARIAWDADQHYLQDPEQEAGRFLRRSIAALGAGLLPPEAAIDERERLVRKVAAPHALAQATYAAQRLAELTEEDRAHSVVVLADENLLLPFLDQLPPDIGPMNVTMGMALNALPVHSLTEAFLELIEPVDDRGSLSLDLFERFITHPFLNKATATLKLIAALRQLQRTRISIDLLEEKASVVEFPNSAELVDCLTPRSAGATGIAAQLQRLFVLAKARAPADVSVQEQLFQMARFQQSLDRVLEHVDIGSIDTRTYRTIRERLLREERIAFRGEPLQGLQVMGLLETRTLDHDRLLLLSMNEGALPRSASLQSWIPFELRRHHQLPLPADAEAISAYHFNRAMQHAGQVEWIHIANGEGNNGEPSRFIAQWEQEVLGRTRTTGSAISVAPTTTARNGRPILVEKDAAIMHRLQALCERGLSPSAIGTWLRCPLDFYFRYVLGIRDTEAVDGDLGSDVLGESVHHVLQSLFTPTIGIPLTTEQVATMVPLASDALTAHLARTFPRDLLDFGNHRLRREMASRALEDHLRAESERVALVTTTVLALELEMQAELPNGVLLRGRADRIDERDGLLTLLDVKTGSVRPEDLKLRDLSREAITPDRRYALQLLIYAWIHMAQHPVERISAGVIPLQRPKHPADPLWIEGSTVLQRAQFTGIGSLLNTLVNELLDPSTPFTHDPESPYCRCCVA